MTKMLEIQCSPRMRDIVVAAIRLYTDVHHPRDGDECSQVARVALLDAANALERDPGADGRYRYNRRMRAMVKEAVRMYFALLEAERGGKFERQRDLLVDVCEGAPHADGELDEAMRADASANRS